MGAFFFRGLIVVITGHADGIAPDGARPSAGTVLTNINTERTSLSVVC